LTPALSAGVFFLEVYVSKVSLELTERELNKDWLILALFLMSL